MTHLRLPRPPLWVSEAMGRISGLVPSRFLTLLAHLVVVITLFWSRVRHRRDARVPCRSHLGVDPAQLSPLLPKALPSPLLPVPGPYPTCSRNPIPPLTFLPFCPAHQESNIQACLPLKFTPEDYEKQDVQ